MRKDTFIRGAFIATACIILTKILGILYVIPFYAIVGDEGIIIYGAAYNIYVIFLNLSTIGLPLAISKLVSEYHALGYESTKQRTYKIAGTIMIVSSVIVTVLLFVMAPFIANNIIRFPEAMADYNAIHGTFLIEEITMVIRVSASAIIFVTLISMMRGYLQGMKYIQPSSISQVIEQAVRVAVILIGSYAAIHVFGATTGGAVALAVFGATLGAMASFVYLKHKKNQIPGNEIVFVQKEEMDITKKDLFKKIIRYTLPLIIMQLIMSAFQMVGMFTMVRTLTTHALFSVEEASIIMNIVTTLGQKLNGIVVAIGMGVVVSLLPNLTSDYTKGETDALKYKINKAIQIVLYLTIPMAVGLSFLAEPVWTMFYGYSYHGSNIFQFSVFTSVFVSLFTTVLIMLQSLSRFKGMYIALMSGFLFNIIMNIPLMVFFHNVGLPIYLGNVLSVSIGMLIAIIIGLYDVKKHLNINYRNTFKQTAYISLAAGVMYGVLSLISLIIPITEISREMTIPIIILYSALGAGIYFGITCITKTFENVIGRELLKDIFRIKKKELSYNSEEN